MNQSSICLLLAVTISLQTYSVLETRDVGTIKLPQPCEMCAKQCSHHCPSCRLAFYCSEECRAQNRDNHTEYCKFIAELIETKEQSQTIMQYEKEYHDRMAKLKKFRKKTINSEN